MRRESPGHLATRALIAELHEDRVDRIRRRQVEAELALRRYFIDPDRRLRSRIPPARSVQATWQQHKYAVLARDEKGYRETGPKVAQGRIGSEALAERIGTWLDQPPAPGGLRNAVEHMWGHVSDRAESSRAEIGDDPFELLAEAGREAVRQDNVYLLEQVALSDLFGWHDG